jgi:RNA polymerase sigma-70 factor, ECF subfamily
VTATHGTLRILATMAESVNTDTEPEIARLLAACARQNRSAFQRLYELTSPQLLGVLIRILRTRALAEDALQEVFLQIWRRAAEFQGERGSSWAWLIAIARYRAIDLQRRERRLAGGGMDGIEDIAGDQEPHDDLISLGRRAAVALDRCVAALQPLQRNCILMSYQGGLTHSEVAARIGEPLGSVKSWIRRGLVALRRCLES